MTDELSSILGKRQVVRHADLEVAGVTRHEVRRLIADGRLRHPSLPGSEPERGLYATEEAMDHPDLSEAVVAVLTNGVFCRQHAAFRHGLSTAFPSRMDILVPASSTIRVRPIYQAIRTRSETSLTLGVEPIENDLGVRVMMTTPARTVIDLMRAMRRNGDDWRHGVEALSTFIALGHDTFEITELASSFEAWLPEIVEAVSEGFSRGHMAP